MTDMTPDRLAELRALADAATAGWPRDAAFITEARTAVPELLDEIEDAWRGLSAVIAQRDEQEMEAKKAWAEVERLRGSATCVHGQTAEELCNLYPSIGEIEELRTERDALAAKVARVEALIETVEHRMMVTAKPDEIRAALAGEQ